MKEIVSRLKENRDIEKAKEILESAGYTVDKTNESTKYRAYYVKNPRGYGSPTYLDKELNSEEETERYCNSFNSNGGYEDEHGNKHYVDYEMIEESAPVDESAKYADWYLESKRLEESADTFKAGDKVEVLLPWTLNVRLDGVIDHRATPEEFKKEKSYIENGVQYFSSAPYPNASDNDEFYMVKVQWKGKDDLLLSPVEGITSKDSKRLKESTEEHQGWDYWEMPKDYRGPWEAKQYQKEYKGELYLTIYPPQEIPGEGHLEDWEAEIQGINHGTSIDSNESGFKSFDDAEAWINSQIEKYDSKGESPARNSDSTDEEKKAYARELLEKAKKSNDEKVAWELIDFLYDTNLLKGF